MITITLENEYEKALIVLALRKFSTSELQNAIKQYESHNSSEGDESAERAENISKIADRIQ